MIDEKTQVNFRLEDTKRYIPTCLCGQILVPASIDAVTRIIDNLKSRWYCPKCGKIYTLNKRRRKKV